MKYKLSNKPLILGIIMIFFLVFIFKTQFPEKYSKYLSFTIRVGVKTYNISNKWHYKFHYLDGKVQGRFTAKNDNAKLIYSSNVENGSIIFQLYDRADSLIITFPASNTIDTLMNIFEKGEKYKIRATATNAKGRFDFKME
ncbi:MAG: hypothetical protein AB2L24_31510 [Mangrovibacterium sp.]